jgi:hypothetical protein
VEFATNVPLFGTIQLFDRRAVIPVSPPARVPKLTTPWAFNGRTIFAVEFATNVPLFGTISPLDGGATIPMEFAILVPFPGSIGVFDGGTIIPVQPTTITGPALNPSSGY